MKDSKLFSILSSFTAKEFRELGRFVNSPFFNRLKNIIIFYENLKQIYPDFSGNGLTEEMIYAKVFPGEEYDYPKFKNLISDMLETTENFLAFKRIRADKFAVKKYLMEELTSRGNVKLFEKNGKEIEKIMDNKMIKGEDYYFNSYQLEMLKGTFNFYKKDFLKENNLRVITDNFINYSLIRILKLYTYMINENLAYKSGDTKFVLINEITEHIKQFSYTETPVIRIYYLILMLTMHDDAEHYFELKDIKHKNKEILDTDEIYNIDTVLRNFCTRMVLSGNKFFLREYFEMLKEEIFDMLEHKKNFISHFRFMNAVITATKLDENQWAEKFIAEYGNYLEPEYKNETLSLTTAMVLFANRQFEKSLDQIRKINFDDCHHKMHLRNLTLQIYYELDYFEPAHSILDSYRHFLRRESSLSEFYRNYNENFVKNYAELLKIKTGESEVMPDEFKHMLLKTDEFANKDWLITKSEELKS